MLGVDFAVAKTRDSLLMMFQSARRTNLPKMVSACPRHQLYRRDKLGVWGFLSVAGVSMMKLSAFGSGPSLDHGVEVAEAGLGERTRTWTIRRERKLRSPTGRWLVHGGSSDHNAKTNLHRPRGYDLDIKSAGEALSRPGHRQSKSVTADSLHHR